MQPPANKTVLAVFLVLVAPFLIVAASIWIAIRIGDWSIDVAQFAFAAAAVSAMAGLYLLPVRLWVKGVLALICVVVGRPVLTVFGLLFMCESLGNCP
ncbi:MAG: hypothetical protein R3E21_10035 [Caenibius sp.]